MGIVGKAQAKTRARQVPQLLSPRDHQGLSHALGVAFFTDKKSNDRFIDTCRSFVLCFYFTFTRTQRILWSWRAAERLHDSNIGSEPCVSRINAMCERELRRRVNVLPDGARNERDLLRVFHPARFKSVRISRGSHAFTHTHIRRARDERQVKRCTADRRRVGRPDESAATPTGAPRKTQKEKEGECASLRPRVKCFPASAQSRSGRSPERLCFRSIHNTRKKERVPR